MAEAKAAEGEQTIRRPLRKKNRPATQERPGEGTKAHLGKPVERRDHQHQLAPDLRPQTDPGIRSRPRDLPPETPQPLKSLLEPARFRPPQLDRMQNLAGEE